MSIKKALIKNTAFNLFGYVYLLFISFFSIALMLKNMGSSMFGLYIFLSSFVPLASVFDFGISLATVRELAYPQNTQREKNKI